MAGRGVGAGGGKIRFCRGTILNIVVVVVVVVASLVVMNSDRQKGVVIRQVPPKRIRI